MESGEWPVTGVLYALRAPRGSEEFAPQTLDYIKTKENTEDAEKRRRTQREINNP